MYRCLTADPLFWGEQYIFHDIRDVSLQSLIEPSTVRIQRELMAFLRGPAATVSPWQIYGEFVGIRCSVVGAGEGRCASLDDFKILLEGYLIAIYSAGSGLLSLTQPFSHEDG